MVSQTSDAEISPICHLVNVGVLLVEEESFRQLSVVIAQYKVKICLVFPTLFVFSFINKGCLIDISGVRSNKCIPPHCLDCWNQSMVIIERWGPSEFVC